MYHKIAQLILTPGKGASSTSDIFIAQPDSAREALAGKLFILVEIESKKIDSLKIINFLVDHINSNYYQNEKIILREKITGLSVEHIFEAALAKTNANFFEFIGNEKIKVNLSALNITVGVIHENTLLFANSGKNKVLLIYRHPVNKPAGKNIKSQNLSDRPERAIAEEEYTIAELSRQKTGAEGAKIDRSKLFSNIISGQIPPKSQFVITSEALPEYISNKQLIEIVTTLPPLSAMEQIKSILSGINAYVSFLSIIIKSTAQEKPFEYKESEQTRASNSIATLNTLEESTETLLTPSGFINFKKWIKYLTPYLSLIFKKNDGQRKSMLFLKDRVLMKKNTNTFLKIFGLKIKNFFIYSSNLIFYLFKITTNRENTAVITDNLSSGAKRFGTGAVSLLFRLNKKGKILLLLLFVLIIAFSINLTFIKKRNDTKEKDNTVKELSALIEQKQNQAEANLLYNNEEGAKKLFSEIESLLAQYPQETEEERRLLAQFREKMGGQLDKVRRITKVEAPHELADFLNLSGQANPDNIYYYEGNNRIYAADAKEKSFYILNTVDKLVTTLSDLKQPLSRLDFPVIDASGNIYYFGGSSVITLNTKKETLAAIPIELADKSETYYSADVYNGRIYYLDSLASQIYRYAINDAKFSAPSAWLKEKIDLSQAVDLAIDGHIYVLARNGEVIKLLQGIRSDFKLDAIDPLFEQPTKIQVSPDGPYIYILEPKQRRLVIFDKSGQFNRQYEMPSLNDLKDFIVDEKNKIVYFLNGSAVFSIETADLKTP